MLGFRKNKISATKDKPEKTGLFSRLKDGLSRTRQSLTGGVADLLDDAEALMAALHDHMQTILEPVSQPLKLAGNSGPFVILMVGINGAGKTTTIGKLAHRFQQDGKKVMLAAGDTFRAAAVEQLQTWGERNDITVIAQQQGADSASVIFDALQSARSRDIDVLIADTAGRLHTQSNLMEELKKIKRVMGKLDEQAPHEVMLVVDAGTGQNALNQAQEFHNTVGLTGITLTKLDGTAKGGIVFAIARQLNIPLRFIGVGEGIENLREFNAKEFVDALFEK
jgi:fused signal recognition particle receptor